ncbi:uncharacterized protein HKW66_Vig0039160 [Vigna angularis]|uniref:Uncharacterized protein n=1 Tax=Phaseolus angularis TaxID=3914 RepID=A0A8T0LAU1_PHAAN|nr:uncharacterized protein HKW66_Vig0039160 [Vigna angularis]
MALHSMVVPHTAVPGYGYVYRRTNTSIAQPPPPQGHCRDEPASKYNVTRAKSTRRRRNTSRKANTRDGSPSEKNAPQATNPCLCPVSLPHMRRRVTPTPTPLSHAAAKPLWETEMDA